ncbi:hypothetical protein NM688_g3744 [Phlebia brevispora]|uniref:Uncharacterized protein n=1 Tax=Phlebia brevispora TaxID=194682 RepID=A0ACC1T585_9APHY|nr:hypothetical protein NM688_g3744 [Phlebia brevispora]
MYSTGFPFIPASVSLYFGLRAKEGGPGRATIMCSVKVEHSFYGRRLPYNRAFVSFRAPDFTPRGDAISSSFVFNLESRFIVSCYIHATGAKSRAWLGFVSGPPIDRGRSVSSVSMIVGTRSLKSAAIAHMLLGHIAELTDTGLYALASKGGRRGAGESMERDTRDIVEVVAGRSRLRRQIPHGLICSATASLRTSTIPTILQQQCGMLSVIYEGRKNWNESLSPVLPIATTLLLFIMGKLGMYDLLSEQWTTLPPPLQSDLSDKIVMVTGGNTGIGFEAVKIFANLHPRRLLLACRSEEKGKQAADCELFVEFHRRPVADAVSDTVIEQETGYHGIELAVFDHGDFNSVIKYAEGFKDEPLDILVANAGVGLDKYEETKDGWEASLQVNHLSTALLSILLLPNLVRTARQNGTHSRLVVVSSDFHFLTKLDDELLDAPNILRKFSDKEYCTPRVMAHRYGDTKLLNVFFVHALSEHLPSSVPVIPTAVAPGYCYSNLRRHRAASFSGHLWYMGMDLLMARTAEQGARQLIWAALGPDGKEGRHVSWLRGAYVSCTQTVKEPSDFVMSKQGGEVQEKIWQETLEILSKTSPDVQACVEEYLTA